VKKTKQKYVLLLLDDLTTLIINFDVEMSKGAHDIFALGVYFLRVDQQLMHPKLLDGLNCESKGENNEKRRSWSVLPSS